ncbi:MAG: class II glutamine amidotransferase [Clostridia bacterium]|nr:class II glutamine amidotransferase [Clostridia bacterium]
MCELLGINSSAPVNSTPYLTEFFSHSVRHPHGWGIMRDISGRRVVFKESVSAKESGVLEDIIKGTEPQTDLLAHIRLATVGGMKNENSHPFTAADLSGRVWTFIHNGTIYSGTALMNYIACQKGDTDSERVFLYLMDEVNSAIKKDGELSERRRFEIVDRLVCTLSPRNKLNLIIFDGEVLYVHKNMKNTLSYKRLENGYVFSTVPLDDGDWRDFPLACLAAYKGGKLIYEGTRHGGVFVPTLEYISAMAAMNI